jgi:metal-responsive CopG/Arc/MetJ family transcriptional regulator
MPAISVYLPDEIYEMVQYFMENENIKKRSIAVAYLIRMGFVYRYKIVEEIMKKEEKEIIKGEKT